jgi:hypothetical protein
VQITGLVVDQSTKAPLYAARVTITREGHGDEIASLAVDAKGRFTFDDDLNEYLGQQLVFTAEHRDYETHRSSHQAERGLTVTLPMHPMHKKEVTHEKETVKIKRAPIWMLVKAWFLGLTRGQAVALAFIPLAALLAVAAFLVFPRQVRPDPLSCDRATIQGATTSADAELLPRIASLCERAGNSELHFVAIEQCAMRGRAPCLMTMARWYDPLLEAQASPFSRRDPELAAEYYRRARTNGAEDARAGLDALCQALRQRGGQEALNAGC